MKERKPLFPEYIWMFFVGLLLAIIVCMRLIPGHADYIVADNPYNDNIIFITLEGKKIHFTSFMGNEIYSTINSNNSDWTEALESDIVSYANNVKLFFGEGNFSVVVVDNYSVSYNYNRFIQLIGPIVGTVYSSYYTGPSEDFLVLNNPWASLSENTFSEYYPTLYTLNLGGYLMPYYKLDPEALPTPTLSPTPTSEPEAAYVYFTRTDYYGSYYYMAEVKASNIGKSVDIDSMTTQVNLIASTYNVIPETFSGFHIFTRLGQNSDWNAYTNGKSALFLFFTADSVESVNLYSLPSASSSLDLEPEYIIENYFPTSLSSSIALNYYSSDSAYSSVFGVCFSDQIFYNRNYDADYSFSKAFGVSYSTSSVSSSDYWYYRSANSQRCYVIFEDSATITTIPSFYGLYGLMGFLEVTPDPNITPSPEPTATPTQAPYVEVILPSGTPTPTPPVTFAGSDLPGGASGEGGSISGAGGMNASEAESIYQYWTNKITNNQALAFLVSFFGLLPFDLVYALGTIIFILILLAMVRLFIHFIS